MIDARVDARGRDYYWLGYRPSLGEPGEGSDLHAVSIGKVAITPLNLNLTDKGLMDDLTAALS